MPLKKKLKSKADEVENLENKDEGHQQEDDASSSSSSGDENNPIESDEESGVDEIDQEQEMLMVDFEARSPLGSDLDSIKMMLKQKFGGVNLVNLDELAKLVVEQGETLGNVIYQAQDDEDEEPVATASNLQEEADIFGVLSVVDLNSPQTKSFSSGFLSYLLKKADFNHIIKNKRVFYVVNER